jgi:hypothetical protein
MFGLITSLLKARRPAGAGPVRPERKVQLGLESLETREAPATLSFASNAYLLGRASLNGSGFNAVRSLSNFNTGDMARKTTGWSQAFASLSNYSGPSDYKTVKVTTSARSQGSTQSGLAYAKTTSTGSGYTYVTVPIGASAGEYWVKRCK